MGGAAAIGSEIAGLKRKPACSATSLIDQHQPLSLRHLRFCRYLLDEVG